MAPLPHSSFLDDDQWETLLRSIADDYCTPILGPEVNTGTLLQREKIAQRLSRISGVYPSLFHTSQLRPTFPPGPKLSQAQAWSYVRCSPIQSVCAPGSLSGRST